MVLVPQPPSNSTHGWPFCWILFNAEQSYANASFYVLDVWPISKPWGNTLHQVFLKRMLQHLREENSLL
jgi:hypothetical protein